MLKLLESYEYHLIFEEVEILNFLYFDILHIYVVYDEKNQNSKAFKILNNLVYKNFINLVSNFILL